MSSSVNKPKAQRHDVTTTTPRLDRPALQAACCEQALISILINHPSIIRSLPVGFRSAHFSCPLHGAAYDAIYRLQKAGRSVSVYSVLAQLEKPFARMGNLSTRQYLTLLSEDRLDPATAGDFADMIVRTAIRREAVAIGEELAESASEDFSIEIILDRTKARLACLLPSMGPQRLQIARLWRSGRRWGDEVAKLGTLQMLDTLPEESVRDPAAVVRAIFEAEGEEGDFEEWADVTFGMAFGSEVTEPELRAFLEGANEAFLDMPV